MNRKPSGLSPIVARYLKRHACAHSKSGELPDPAGGLKLCVVIPSLAERGLLGRVLSSLEQGSARLAETEVIVPVNNPVDPEPDILADNLATLQELYHRNPGPLRVIAADYASPGRWLDPQHAGVGLARRLGMDLALRRLAQGGDARRAAIACLDADSPVAPGYIDALLEAFDREDAPRAGVCAYAHALPDDPRLAAAMVAYELWLRYFEAGLRLAGSIFAFPTIGSCMAVSAEGYALADGMPVRRAGEDFHFLRKLAKISGPRPLARIDRAKVFPAARISRRVPFGTGRAMLRCLESGVGEYQTVAFPESFFNLRVFFAETAQTRDVRRLRAGVRGSLADFLENEKAWPVMEKLAANYPAQNLFARAVQHWFDSLRIVRYVNYCGRISGRTWIFDALSRVFTGLNQASLLQDLPRIPAGEATLPLHRQWLERLRSVSPQ